MFKWPSLALAWTPRSSCASRLCLLTEQSREDVLAEDLGTPGLCRMIDGGSRDWAVAGRTDRCGAGADGWQTGRGVNPAHAGRLLAAADT